MTDNYVVKNDGEDVEVGLADIAGIDMANVEEFEGGFEPTPKGVYHWRCSDAGLDEVADKPVIYFESEVVECLGIVHESKTEEEMAGWKHRETIFIQDLAKGVGQAKAIMTNSGFKGSGTLSEMLDAFVGHEFVAPITQRKDKNDTDRIYANLKIGKITPVPQASA